MLVSLYWSMRRVKDEFLPVLARRLQEKQVEIRADEAACELIPGAVPCNRGRLGQRVFGLYSFPEGSFLCRRSNQPY